jgi:hypothetical protein
VLGRFNLVEVIDDASSPDIASAVTEGAKGSRSETMIRFAAAALGMSALIAGAFAVFVSDNGVGTAALLGVGVVLLIIAIFGNRVIKLRGGGVEVELAQVAVRSAAAQLEVAATRAELHGDEEAARAFRAQAEAVLDLAQVASPAAQAYEQLRRTMGSGYERTAKQQEIVNQARAAVHEREHEPSEVRELFNSGRPGNRIYALGLMQEDPRLGDFSSIIDAIRGSRSAFEQYTALYAAEAMLPNLGTDERRRLKAALEAERSRYITPDTDRWPVAERILSNLR